MTSNIKSIIAAIAAGGGAGSFAYFAPQGFAAPVATVGVAGVQTVAITGTATAGTFTLTYNGSTTAPIPYNAVASAVAAAINTAAGLTGGAQVTASGGPLPTAVPLTFPPRLRQTALTANGAALVGTTPAVTVTQSTPGTQSTSAAFAVPGAGWNDAGWCDPKGLDLKSNISSTDIKGFGNFQPLTTIVTEVKKTIDVTFLETNPTVLAIYNSLPLASVAVAADGSTSLATGNPAATQYAGYFLFNNANLSGSSFYLPNMLVTNQGDLTSSMGAIVQRAVTMTAYPDSLGNAVYENHQVAALAS